MKKGLLSILSFIISLTAIGQCSMSFTLINSIWCNCTGYLLANPTGIPPFSYQWSTGDTTNFIDSLCPGAYTCTVTDSLGCVAIDSATITNSQPPMNILHTYTPASCATCCDAIIDVDVVGGCPPFSYNWEPYPSAGFCPGVTYTVTIIDACGCSGMDTITPSFSVGLNEQHLHNNITYQIINKTIIFSVPITDLKIYDLLGNLVYRYSTNVFSKAELFNLKTGLFIIKVNTLTGQVFTDKISLISD